MAYNRKMRKFEGTCYIPGEQLAMMAKYYRGANLNLNLTLFEDDLAAMQDTLDQSCWCSKLNEVDRMKMAHMKGNEWRIAHDHCLEEAVVGPREKKPQLCPQRSKSAVSKVERGTSALSLYDRERGLVRSGRYQTNSGPSNRGNDFDGRQYHRHGYNHPRDDRGYYPNSQKVRGDYDSSHRRDTYGQPEYNTQVAQNVTRTDPNLSEPFNRRYDMESEAMSSPEVTKEIRCAVCNVETCLVCKNHLYSLICQCKCPVANAGLCNQCNQQPCEEDEHVAQESGGKKTDMSSMMLTMMMSSILKQFQAPESVCCCKPGKDNSESSSNSLDERVHKVYLYDCENQKKCMKYRAKSIQDSDSSLPGNCCKCLQKPKKTTGKEGKEPESSDEETNFRESGASQKHQSTKDNTSKDINSKPPVDNYEYNKSILEDDASSKFKTVNDNGGASSKTNRGPIESRNVRFSATCQKNQGLSSVKLNQSRAERSPHKSLTRLGGKTSELLDTQHSVPDLESLNLKDEELVGSGDDCIANGLREFIACLPKIQLNLQNLVSKLNQMDLLNNLNQQAEPISGSAQRCSDEKQTGNGFPLISSQEFPLRNPPGLMTRGHAHSDRECKNVDNEIKLSRLNLPSTASLGSYENGSNAFRPPPSTYHSALNFSNLREIPESETPLEGRKAIVLASVPNELPKITQSTIKIPPTGVLKSHSGNHWSSHKRNPVQSPLMAFPIVGQEQSNFGREPSSGFCKQKCVKIHQYNNANEVAEDGMQSISNLGFTDRSHMPESMFHNNRSDNEKSRNSTKLVFKTVTTDTMPSRYEKETHFQSYNRSSTETSVQGLTDYASFTDNKCLLMSPDTAVQQSIHNPMNGVDQALRLACEPNISGNYVNSNPGTIPKCPRNLSKDRTLLRTRSVLKVQNRVSFKTKKRNPFSLENLLQGCNLRGSGTRENGSENLIADHRETPKFKVDRGVGPGKFRRSKYDSNLNPSDGKTLLNNKVRPLGLLEDARTPDERDRFGSLNISKGCTADQTESMLKITNSFAQREVGSDSYIVSSVDVQAIDVSSSEIIKIVQGIASRCPVNGQNASSAPNHSGTTFSEDMSLLPLPRSTSDSRSENLGEAALEKRLFLDNEVSSNTPVFLRKSQWQVEQLKKAHATIRSMINNVNEVIDHIDSDSKIGIKSNVRRQSYFVHVDDSDAMNPSESQERNDGKCYERKAKCGNPCKSASNRQDPKVQEMFLSVNRVINSALSTSEQSTLTEESHSQLENTTPLRAHRDFFVLNSNSSTSAFTESLIRSLENDTSRSIPLMTKPLPPSRRTRSTRPLKKRSWFPYSKPR